MFAAKGAKSIAKRYLTDKQYAHTERVAELCEKFSEEFSEIDKNLLMDAAWLHDIGKAFAREKRHAEKDVVDEALENVGWDNNRAEVSYIIHRHKGKFHPKRHIIECSILRICDKLDKYNKDDKKHPKQHCKESMEKIREVLRPDELEKFETVYRRERERLSISRRKRKIMRENMRDISETLDE